MDTFREIFIRSQIVACECELQSMLTANAERVRNGDPLAYQPHEIADLPARYGISHNQVIEYLRQ